MICRSLLLLCVLFVDIPAVTLAQEPAPKPSPAKDERLNRDTPEGTLRVFMLGVAASNEQLITATAIPLSDDDRKLLLIKIHGENQNFKELKEEFASLKIERLKPGDKFKLPNGKEIVVAAEEVGDDRLVLKPENAPLPSRLYKAKGYWWVDAGPFVAGRKAAEAMRKAVKTEMDGLEGTWDVVSAEYQGKAMEADNSPATAVIHDGKATFSFSKKSGKDAWEIKLDVNPRPKLKESNLLRPSGERLPCIYERTDDTLKLAMPAVPKERKLDEPIPRPASFESKDKQVVILVAKRKKAASEDAKTARP